MVKSPGEELSSAFGTSKGNLRLLKYPSIICLYAWGTEKKLWGGVLPLLYESPYSYTLKRYMYIIRLLQCIHMGISRDWYGFIYNLCHDHFKSKAVSWFVSELYSEFYPDIKHDGNQCCLRPWLFLIFYLCHTLLRRVIGLSICCFLYLSSHFNMSLYSRHAL